MYTLLAHARSSPEHQAKAPNARSIPTLDPRGDLWARVVDFLDRFDSRQVRYAGMEFRRLVEIVLKTAKSLRKVWSWALQFTLFVDLFTAHISCTACSKCNTPSRPDFFNANLDSRLLCTVLPWGTDISSRSSNFGSWHSRISLDSSDIEFPHAHQQTSEVYIYYCGLWSLR